MTYQLPFSVTKQNFGILKNLKKINSTQVHPMCYQIIEKVITYLKIF